MKAHILSRSDTCLRDPNIFESELLSGEMKKELKVALEWWQQEEAKESIQGTKQNDSESRGGSTGSRPREGEGDFKAGFDQGFEEGRRSGHQEGHQEGFSAGYEKGFAVGARIEPHLSTEFPSGKKPRRC